MKFYIVGFRTWNFQWSHLKYYSNYLYVYNVNLKIGIFVYLVSLKYGLMNYFHEQFEPLVVLLYLIKKIIVCKWTVSDEWYES